MSCPPNFGKIGTTDMSKKMSVALWGPPKFCKLTLRGIVSEENLLLPLENLKE
jgi:hypothetical protein